MIVNTGIRRFLGSAIQRLFNSASFYAPLTHSLVPERGTGSPTFTRASTATVVGYGPTDNAADGLKLLTVAANEARFVGARRISEGVWSNTFADGSLIPAATNTGYLAEGAATNLCLQSQTIATAPWQIGNGIAVTADQYVAPDGTTTVDKLTALAGNTQHFWYQQITTTAGAATYSVYLRYVNNQWARIGIYDGAGSYYAAFDILNGVAGSTLGSVTATAIEPMADGVTWRVSLTATIGASVLSQVYLSVANADDPSFGLWNAAGTEAIGAWGAQLELGSFASTYIPTTTAAVTRAADVLTYPSAGNISGTVGAAYAEASTVWSSGTSVYNQLVGSYTTAVGALLSRGGVPTEIVIRDGTGVVAATGLPTMYGVPRKLSSNWSGSTSLITGSGATPTSGAFDGDMGFTSIPIGCSSLSDAQWYGTIRNVRIWQRALSASEMQAITS